MEAEELKTYVEYNPNTGRFTWIKRPSNRVKVGTEAGYYCTTHGYVTIRLKSKLYKAHRLAFLYMTGKFPSKDLVVDHINRDKTDNRWCNLRETTQQTNVHNSSIQKNSKTKVTGVSFNEARQKYVARIYRDGKQYHLGSFDSIETAKKKRLEAERLYD